MALHPDFPDSPHAILDPELRWFPADEALRDTTSDKLMPPLVAQLRSKVKEFRDSGYVGATDTSRSLLKWWFQTKHLMPQADGTVAGFEYYFAQREAIETIVYLMDVIAVQEPYDLMRFDSSGLVSRSMFDEHWRRLVVKMATGSGKTKVLALGLALSYFHKLYEVDSPFARNFLVIAPNIIVLDRIFKDFQGLRIFHEDPVIPDNGFDGRYWKDDFQLTLHVQDEVNVTQPTGNIFLTNIHRVYDNNIPAPTADDADTMEYFLGPKPTGQTTDSKVDLGVIVRDIDELMVLNDEAHHVHDKKLAWFKSIEDIHNRLIQKGGQLALQLDVTATPKHNNGAIFVQTVADYPLVEAISQNVVKHPVLPDAASQGKLQEKQTTKYTERYADFLDLGVIEWRSAYEEHIKVGKKSILFVMTDDTKNCDEVAQYLEGRYPDLKDAVLTIHTNKSGEISESKSKKAQEELDKLREQANSIDSPDSPYKAIVSVLMLKEGWDVRNVTTIVGLRSYSSKASILPEQTLGRGLRKMYPGPVPEQVSIVGTENFMEFVESIQAEGVELERKAMGSGTKPKAPIVVEIDQDNTKKDLDALDIEVPVLTPRIYREYKQLADLDVAGLTFQNVTYQQFSAEEQREIVFKDITTGEVTHTTILDTAGIADYRSVLGYFTQTVMKELRLVGGYDVLYGKIKTFVQDYLFGQSVELEDANTLRNLSEMVATKTILDTIKKAVNDLTVQDKGDAEIRDTIKLRQTRPFVAKDQEYIAPKKSVFNRIIGDSHFELIFANFLEGCGDVVAYAKNYLAVHFKLDYVNADGEISNYYPDFFVKLKDDRLIVVETKGQEDLDVPLKMARLKQWCQDVGKVQNDQAVGFVFVDQNGFEKHTPSNFAQLLEAFTEYQ